jgi:hypothetical protein
MFSGGQLSRSRGPLKLHNQAALQLRQSHRASEYSSKGSVLLPLCRLCCTLSNTHNVNLVEESFLLRTGMFAVYLGARATARECSQARK